MATQIVQAPQRAERTTAPLPSAAVDAMRRLELALADPDVVRAVTRYEVASARTAELSAAMDTRNLSGAEVDSLVLAQDVMAAARTTLASAGQLHLIEVAR
ncbi:hypothetical protein AB0F36_14350 [Streptomyces sp. NPDC029080]|uniref:hypothetical protein n=1 Tax=Streptomyces sp. NPDC029080 TaxID=3155017 RepID=UPI0034108355